MNIETSLKMEKLSIKFARLNTKWSISRETILAITLVPSIKKPLRSLQPVVVLFLIWRNLMTQEKWQELTYFYNAPKLCNYSPFNNNKKLRISMISNPISSSRYQISQGNIICSPKSFVRCTHMSALHINSRLKPVFSLGRNNFLLFLARVSLAKKIACEKSGLNKHFDRKNRRGRGAKKRANPARFPANKCYERSSREVRVGLRRQGKNLVGKLFQGTVHTYIHWGGGGYWYFYSGNGKTKSKEFKVH